MFLTIVQQAAFLACATLRFILLFIGLQRPTGLALEWLIVVAQAYELSFAFVTMTGILLMLPLVTIFSTNFSILVIIFENLITDLGRWLLLSGFFIASFATWFAGLHYTDLMSAPNDDFVHSDGPLAAPLWAMFGAWNANNFKSDAPLYYNIGALTVFIYTVIANLMLVNLLIAMFSDTYATLSALATDEDAYQKCKALFVQRHIQLTMPPPFNLLLSVWEIFGHPLTSFRFVRSGPRIKPGTHDDGKETDRLAKIKRDGSICRDAFVAKHGL